MRIAALMLGIVIAAGACASKQTAAADQQVTASTTRARQNVISSQEIRESKATSLADLIRQSRPSWPRTAMIFLNNDADPSGTALQRSPTTVNEIRYLTKSEAQTKWGSRVNEVIQIVTR
jgi:hypothetical protein